MNSDKAIATPIANTTAATAIDAIEITPRAEILQARQADRNAWRRWAVTLHDGQTVVEVIARNETHARCVIAFGEEFFDHEIARKRYIVHPDDIGACVAVEWIAPSSVRPLGSAESRS